MKTMILAQAVLAVAVAAWAGEKAGVETVKARIAVGKTYTIKLPCNPTTGFNWELKSIDREIAAPKGDVEFKEKKHAPGMVGVGGTCTLKVTGVKAGKTTAVLVYRRPCEKDTPPAETYKADITVVAAK